MRALLGLGAAAVLLAAAVAQPQTSLVVRERRPVSLKVRLERPARPGFVKSLDRYVPHNLPERRRLHYQFKRLLTLVTGRWVPDTTSLSTIFYRLNRLPTGLKQKALFMAAAGPVAMWAQGWTRRQFRRYKVPVVEPGSQGVRLKPVRLTRSVRAWYEWRLSRRTYTYLYVSPLRVVGFHSRSPDYTSTGIWCSPKRRWSFCLQRAAGRSWRSMSLTVQHYTARSFVSWQAYRIESRWDPGWRVCMGWAWFR